MMTALVIAAALVMSATAPENTLSTCSPICLYIGSSVESDCIPGRVRASPHALNCDGLVTSVMSLP